MADGSIVLWLTGAAVVLAAAGWMVSAVRGWADRHWDAAQDRLDALAGQIREQARAREAAEHEMRSRLADQALSVNHLVHALGQLHREVAPTAPPTPPAGVDTTPPVRPARRKATP